MDKAIPKKKWPASKIMLILGVVGFTSLLAYLIFSSGGGTRLNVDVSRISLAQVHEGEFQEYIPITGSVQPHTTVYMDLEEGGIVEQIHIQGGVPVKTGDLILSFSNATAQKANIDSESRQLDTLNQLRTQKFNLRQEELLRQEQLLDLNKQIQDAERRFKRFEQLMDESATNISKDEFEALRDNVTYLKERKGLLQERIRQENVLREQQEQSIDESIDRTNRALEVLAQIIDSLEVRAPIDGHLSSMNAEIGQSFTRGQRIGQIDQLDSFKVRADIDQYYISRVIPGQVGTFDFGGQTYQLQVDKIYPEVTNNAFQVDLEFVDNVASGIKRGQTLQIDLSLSESTSTKIVNKGGFYRHTNGRWVYKISEDGTTAIRVPIVSGRQNPQSFEILEGLEIGDTIITSGYDTFNDVDVLNFSEPVRRK
jgi:HlyD family secretion protein